MNLEDENDRLVQIWASHQRSYLTGKKGCVGHHFYSRRHLLLRWDILNIIPLTPDEHRDFHDGKFKIEIRNPFRRQHLDNMINKDFKDYLLESGMTKKDFIKERNLELRRIISEL